MVDTDKLLAALRGLAGGVVDTSTLIYLERLELLPRVAGCVQLVLIPQVIAEFGGEIAGATLLATAPTGTTDQAVCRSASLLHLPVLSEDRQVLLAARRLGLGYYNTLMLLLALCARGDLPLAAYPQLRRRLSAFARYGRDILAVGDALFHALGAARPGG
ncbi:hypothetical protein Despr_0639 [Desulfobulbus propionicus DSM 2032]|jgi:hypothetical protein|uniref:DUF3368 domain-containing protein n=1 Tax=Desulfobulbus propionicus (strain ATCC 33891 / DSM 2032 / VKM B-1956 / 1pr3) TaxID=577650 RepID=A0A7U3YK13_DESPD|nr:hypothetical protein [Desulfobulbus propionicus]ADW16815.1 hypothetical protein Despr_0639 [Desulfobulbus propionicus DSM 2032]